MIEHLKLTNFKRHENLELDFGSGLTVLAGANEAGKSSVLHAILYVLYGSRALPRSLDGTVTYGKPVSSLRVDMRIRISGVTYTLYRAKSGAEISGGGLLASGAAEVTAVVERLLGVPAATAAKLLIANQGSLRGVVEEGSAAVKLIEELAQLDAIEALVEKVQTQLPTGNTAALMTQAASLTLPEPVQAVVDVDGPVAAAAEAAAALAEVAARKAEMVAQDLAAVRAEAEHAEWRREASRLKAIIDAPQAVPTVRTVTDIAQLQAAQAQQAADKLTRQAWAAWQMLTPVPHPGDAPTVDHKTVQALQLELQAARMQRINDESCGLCGKLLQDVPEVVSGNAAVDAKVLALQAQLESAKEAKAAQELALTQWSIAIKQRQSYEMGLARLSGYVKDEVWAGGDVPATPDTTNYAALISEELAKQKQMAAEAERFRRDQADRAAAQAALASLAPPATAQTLRPDLGPVTAEERTARTLAASTAEAAQAAKVAASASAARFNAETCAYIAAGERRAELLQTVESMEVHNALVKKLRLARPEIATKLWGGLLQAISQTFSTLRGAASVVSRDADGFAVDGKPVADLSGSTLDVLGLAVRVALLRAFLPSVGLLILDEPAAAMDAERESILLGTLVSLGLEQVLMVSHSDAAKSVAQDVVSLG